MTGRYLICTPVESARNERRFDKAWRRFAELCRSLHRDGLDYTVQFNLTDAKPHVLNSETAQAIDHAPRDPAAPSTRAMLQGPGPRGGMVPA